MKYMLIIVGEEGGWQDVSPEDMKAEMGRWFAYGQELEQAGAHIAGEGLQESHTARTVRVSPRGERLVTDGPFAESKEQVGGFYLIECSGDDEALEWAKKIPLRAGAVEVRPVMDYTQFDPEAAAAHSASA